MLISFACMLGLAAVAKPLILILIGVKWLPAVYFLQIICFAGMLYPLHAINLNILQVRRYPAHRRYAGFRVHHCRQQE